jgi:cold shock protein
MRSDGRIKTLVGGKGFGFIVPDGGRERDDELFFHRSAVSGGATFEDLREGQRVNFEVGQGPKGPRAEDVRPAD